MSKDSEFPEFFPLRQHFASHAIDDIPSAVGRALSDRGLTGKIGPGESVAIAVGSRGVANLSTIVAEVVRFVKSAGGEPMIVPAMGSHGGATAEGQKKVLAKYGVDESIGCPVASSMETVHVGTTESGVHVNFDKNASRADHVIVVNRVKPHTRLNGKFESGLIKMMMIGLGKREGATFYHQVFPDYGYKLDDVAPEVIGLLVEKMPITMGLAIVEDAYEETSLIEAVPPDSLLSREPELLEIAKSRMPKLPFDHVDLLIVDQIGKEISGTGMDTNVIGRKTNDRCAAPEEYPKIHEIYVRSLTTQTAGNACGVGMSEYCHRRVIEAMDAEITKVNCITAAHPTGGAVPLAFPTDRDVLEAVVSQTGEKRMAKARWMWISDSLHISRLMCSRNYLDEARRRDDLEVLSDPQPLEFDRQGDLSVVNFGSEESWRAG